MKSNRSLVFVAAAALALTGLSVANAQNSRTKPGNGSTPNGRPFQYLADLIAQNSTAITSLQQSSTSLLTELQALAARVASNETAIAENSAAIGGLATEIGAIKSEMAQQQTQLGGLLQQLVALDGKVDANKAETEAAIAALGNELRTSIGNLGELYNELNARLTAQQSELAALKIEVAEKNTAVLGQIDALNALILEVRASIPTTSDINAIVANNALVIDLQTQVGQLQAGVSTVTNNVLALDGEVSLLSANLSNLTQRVGTTESAVLDLNVRVTALESAGGLPPLDTELPLLVVKLGEIKSALPNAYTFTYDGSLYGSSAYANSIIDGGYDMFDGGNVLQSTLVNNGVKDYFNGAASIPYTASQIAVGDNAFGTGSAYYTIAGSGVFVLSVRNATVDRVWIAGNTGADGGGSVEAREFTVTSGGRSFRVFSKTIVDGYNYDPAIVHLWILPATAEVEHLYSSITDSDYDEIHQTGGAALGDLYYLLLSTRPSYHPTQAQLEEVATRFLDATK